MLQFFTCFTLLHSLYWRRLVNCFIIQCLSSKHLTHYTMWLSLLITPWYHLYVTGDGDIGGQTDPGSGEIRSAGGGDLCVTPGSVCSQTKGPLIQPETAWSHRSARTVQTGTCKIVNSDAITWEGIHTRMLSVSPRPITYVSFALWIPT